jgi:hypothetical protein
MTSRSKKRFACIQNKPKSFHEKAGTCQDGFFFFFSGGFFRLSRAASVAILPSALFVSEFSLGASWASFVQ